MSDESRDNTTNSILETSAAIVDRVQRMRRHVDSSGIGQAELDAELSGIEGLAKRLERQVESLSKQSGGKPDRVESSVIEEVTYGYDMPVLTIRFRNGLVYRYYDVPESVYQELLAAESKGRYFNANIRDAYEYSEFWWMDCCRIDDLSPPGEHKPVAFRLLQGGRVMRNTRHDCNLPDLP
jgi:hypothetical protein